jgi:hypothetical protein
MSETSTKAITPVGTLSYPHIAKAQEPLDGKGNAKFSATVIFAPGVDLSALKAAAVAAAEAAYPGKGAKMLETGALRSPFRTDCEAKNYGNCAAFINVRTEKKPGAVFNYADPATGKAKIVPEDQIEKVFYPGAQVKVSINAFAYNSAGNKGVSFALNNIQKVADGERIDGRVAAENEFTDLSAAPAGELPF